MNTEIKDGFTKIKSEKQLQEQPDGFYLLVDHSGTQYRAIFSFARWGAVIEINGSTTDWNYAEIRTRCSAFRHVPDAAPELSEVEALCAGCGIAKSIYITNAKQYFCSTYCCTRWISEHSLNAAPVAEQVGGFEKKTEFGGRSLDELAYATGAGVPTTPIAQELVRAYAEIDRQAAELAQLKAAREWQPVTVEALENAPDGSFEFFGKDGLLNATVKYKGAFIRGYEVLTEHYSHFRLITRADEFTPPERKIKLDGEYTVAELEQILKESE